VTRWITLCAVATLALAGCDGAVRGGGPRGGDAGAVPRDAGRADAAAAPPVDAGGGPAADAGGGPASDAGGPGVDAGGGGGALDPPRGGSSGGTGGAAGVGGATMTASGTTYRLIVPSSYRAGTPTPLLVVYSGTEGGAVMTMNLMSLSGAGIIPGLAATICAVLDGVTYRGDAAAGARVLDAVRAAYDVDNDRTYLLGESAGTTAALALGLHLRQSYFAAFWANDVNACDTPERTAAMLGFAPWGQAGPGGDLVDARCIIDGMRTAGYRLDPVSPYAGPGSTMHGSTDQFIAALSWFDAKSR